MTKKIRTDKNEKEIIGKGLNENLSLFLRHIDAIRDTFLMELLLFMPYGEKSIKKFYDFIDNNAKKINGTVAVKVEDYKMFKQLERDASTSSLALGIISNSLFVSLISRYDAFLSGCLKEIFKIETDIPNGFKRTVCFLDIANKESVEDIKNDIIEKEIQELLREDHLSQLEYLEDKLKIIIKDAPLIEKTFLEITERRNLIVHCDGVVSEQYMKKCKPLDIKIGDKLTIQPEYLISVYKCLYELSVKLTHTLWRKLLKNELEQADSELHKLCFDLIDNKSFVLADNLLVFALEQKNIFDEIFKNLNTVNAALSKYLQNNKQEAQNIINSRDWSASGDNYKLACAILNDDYKEAYKIMLKIGNKNELVDETSYRSWPLFLKIRKEDEFKKTYKKIFNKEYSVSETPIGVVQTLLKKKKGKTKKTIVKK